MEQKIRVVVVDDSALMRKKLREMIEADEGCEVIATARDGEEAIKTVAALQPDVVIMDLQMPNMDGHSALKYIMSEWPTPVVMVSAFTQEGAKETLQCLEEGAVDFVAKPGGTISRNIDQVASEILEKIKTAAKANVQRLKPLLHRPHHAVKKIKEHVAETVIVIACSTGGPRALSALLTQFNNDLKAGIVVIQHMPEGFTHSLAERLNAECQIPVSEAKEGEMVREGEILIAPGGFQMKVEEGEVKLLQKTKEQILSPCADVTMKSLAPLYGKKCVGVVLTGMGNDGTEGLRAIKSFGGTTLAEAKETSVVYGMPRAALEAGVVDRVVPLSEMAEAILKVMQR